MGIDFPVDDRSVEMVVHATGGLPLAIQWVLGCYRVDNNLPRITESVNKKDSPLLEFSFRNIWQRLSPDAKATLAAMTIFDEPPTADKIAIATEFSGERIERAIAELGDVTLVSKSTQSSDGRTVHLALPITLSFARNQLGDMGDFDLSCRKRYQQYVDQITLQESEIFRFREKFSIYGLSGDNERRAAILCQRAESEYFLGNLDNADALFRQARQEAPQSSYVFAMNASYELTRHRAGNAIQYIEVACSRATKTTGALCFTIRARIMSAQRNLTGQISALQRALDYSPEDYYIRHQYGVALSKSGRTEDAIKEFSSIVEQERNKPVPTVTLLAALKARMINLKRLGRISEFDQDLKYATSILRDYVHLSSEASHFSQFFEDNRKN